jgi:hypothetical protein
MRTENHIEIIKQSLGEEILFLREIIILVKVAEIGIEIEKT